MRSLSRLLLVVCLTLTAAVAIAAEPESGKLSAATPEVKWSGSAGPYPANFLFWDETGAGEECEQPRCDVFTLDVTDGPADITFTMTTTNYGNIEFDVTKPDGSTAHETSPDNEPMRKLTIKNAPNGTYKVNTWPYGMGSSAMEYTGVAKRAGAPATGTPGPGATATPGPGATATPGPAAKPTITIKAGKQSARKVKKAMTVTLTASSKVTNVLATLKKGSKKLGTGKLASLEGTKKIKLKLSKKIKKGKYTLLVQADDGQGGKVTATTKVTVKK